MLWVGILLACLPIVVTLVKAGTDHYLPTGDNAILASRAGDVFTTNSPTLGMTSSLEGYNSDAAANHPGPLLFWVFSVPYVLSGQSTVGFLVAILLLEGGSVVLIAVVAHRRAGPVLAFLLLLGVGLVEWSLSGPTLAFPQNPFVTVLPFLAYLVLCWTLACGDGWALAPAIFLGSLCVQGHLSYGVVVAVPGLVSFGAFAAGRWVGRQRVRRALEAARPGRTGAAAPRALTRRAASPGSRSHGRQWLTAATVTVACWAPPVVQQLSSSKPNLSAIVRGLQPSANTTRLLPSVAYDVMWNTFGVSAVWMRQRQGFTTPRLGQLSAIAVFVLAGVLTVWAWRRGLRSLAWLLTLADMSVVAVYLTARSAPNTLDPQSFRYLWAAGPFLWAAVLAGVLAWARPRLRVLRAGTKRVEEVLLLGLFVLAVVGAVTSDPLGRRANADELRTTREVAALTRQLLPALRTDRTYGMSRAGNLALLSIGPGLYRNLDQHGRHLHMVDNDVDAYGLGRSSRQGLAGTLLLVSGDRATSFTPPDGSRVVARVSNYRADTATRLRSKILRALDQAGNLQLTRDGETYIQELVRLLSVDPGGRKSLEDQLRSPVTVPAIKYLLAHPHELVHSGAAEDLLGSGKLNFLVAQKIVAPSRSIADLIERYEPLRDSQNDATVYLAPPGSSAGS